MNKQIYSQTGRLMMSYGKDFRIYMKKALAPCGINVAEAMILMLLYEEDGRTQDQLLECVHYDKSVMTRTMQSLETGGICQRRQNPDDGRSWIFVLTQRGKDLKPQVIAALNDWCSLAFHGVSEEDVRKLHDILWKLKCNIES